MSIAPMIALDRLQEQARSDRAFEHLALDATQALDKLDQQVFDAGETRRELSDIHSVGCDAGCAGRSLPGGSHEQKLQMTRAPAPRRYR
jgi:hypothetical protein